MSKIDNLISAIKNTEDTLSINDLYTAEKESFSAQDFIDINNAIKEKLNSYSLEQNGGVKSFKFSLGLYNIIDEVSKKSSENLNSKVEEKTNNTELENEKIEKEEVVKIDSSLEEKLFFEPDFSVNIKKLIDTIKDTTNQDKKAEFIELLRGEFINDNKELNTSKYENIKSELSPTGKKILSENVYKYFLETKSMSNPFEVNNITHYLENDNLEEKNTISHNINELPNISSKFESTIFETDNNNDEIIKENEVSTPNILEPSNDNFINYSEIYGHDPIKTYVGTLVNFGPELFEPNNKDSLSFFIDLKDSTGNIKRIWGKELSQIKDTNISAGDNIIIENFGKKDVSVPINKKDEKGKPYVEYISAKRNTFELQKYNPQLFKDEVDMNSILTDAEVNELKNVINDSNINENSSEHIVSKNDSFIENINKIIYSNDSIEDKKSAVLNYLNNNTNKDCSPQVELIDKLSTAQKLGASFKVISSYIDKIAHAFGLEKTDKAVYDKAIQQAKSESGGENKKVPKTTYQKLIKSLKIIIPIFIAAEIFFPQHMHLAKETVSNALVQKDTITPQVNELKTVYDKFSVSEFKAFAECHSKIFDTKEIRLNHSLFEKITLPQTKDDFKKLEIVLDYDNCFTSFEDTSNGKIILNSSFYLACKEDRTDILKTLLNHSDKKEILNSSDYDGLGLLALVYRDFPENSKVIDLLENEGFTVSNEEVNILTEKFSERLTPESKATMFEKLSSTEYDDSQEKN